MASRQSTVDFIVEQASAAGVVSSRKMFGEYALFCDGKLVALICDDQLFVKPTKAGRAYIGDPSEASPYRGAKPSFVISGEKWDDADWLAGLFKVSAAELPVPVKNKPRSKPRRI